MMNYEPIIAVISYLVVIVIVFRFLPKPVEKISLQERISVQDESIKNLEAKYLDTLEQLNKLNLAYTKQEELIASLYQEIQDLRKQEELISSLYQEIQDLKHRVGLQKKSPKVLAIWPEPKSVLATNVEEIAIYNAGFTYRSLREAKAAKEYILAELERDKYDILEIGAHGQEEGIELSDGLAIPGWWVRALKDKNISLVVLLACTSDNVGDGLIRAKIVPFVITVQREIQDTDSIKFVEIFYNRISLLNKLDVSNLRNAVEYAQLVLPHDVASAIRFRSS